MATSKKGTTPKKKTEIKKRTNKVSATTKKIKKNEGKYTFLLVLFFILLFVVIGYFTLRVQEGNNVPNTNNSKIASEFRITSSGEVITLTAKDILPDAKGLMKDGYVLNYKNESSENIKYRIRLVRDKDMEKECDCTNRQINYENIKYSLDGINIGTLTDSDMVLTEGVINSDNDATLNVKLWVDKNYNEKDHHFHGHLEIEEIV